jgi:hypothetical protein
MKIPLVPSMKPSVTASWALELDPLGPPSSPLDWVVDK